MRILSRGDPLVFGPGNGLAAGVGRVVDEVGRPGAARVHARLDIDIPELGYGGVRHFLGQLAQPGRGGIPLHPRAVHLVHHDRSSSGQRFTGWHQVLVQARWRARGTRALVRPARFVNCTQNRHDYCTGLATDLFPAPPINRRRLGIDQWPGPISVFIQVPAEAPDPWSPAWSGLAWSGPAWSGPAS